MGKRWKLSKKQKARPWLRFFLEACLKARICDAADTALRTP